MDYKKVVSDALQESEKKEQEKQIERIKRIVQSILEKIDKRMKEKEKLDKEIRVLKNDLDDLKAGRLDKIEERQQKDDEARNYSIIYVERIEKEYVPAHPWRSPWIVYSKSDINISDTMSYTIGSINNPNVGLAKFSTSGASSTAFTTGTFCKTFTAGTYNVNGKIINL